MNLYTREFSAPEQVLGLIGPSLIVLELFWSLINVRGLWRAFRHAG